MYTEKVMQHFAEPKNVGIIEDADGIGEVGNPVCGDMMTFYIKVKDDRIEDVKYQTFGCVAAIAVSSQASEMVKGRSLEEAKMLTKAAVAEALGGLPKQKMHCSNLGADALALAIQDYENKAATGTADGESSKEKSCGSGSLCSACHEHSEEVTGCMQCGAAGCTL